MLVAYLCHSEALVKLVGTGMIDSVDRPGDVPALTSALDEVIIDLDDCEVRVRAEKSKQ